MMMAPETVGLSRVSGERIAQSSDGGEGGWSAYVERRTVSPGAGQTGSRTVSPRAGQTTQAGTAAAAGRCIGVVDIPHLQLLTAELPFQGVICSVNVESALPGFS